MKKNFQRRQKSNLTKIEIVLPQVKEDLGLENNLKITALNEIWPLITSFGIANQSKILYFDREQNIVIGTANSALAMELSMKKIDILNKLRTATKNTDIFFKDIRFVHKG